MLRPVGALNEYKYTLNDIIVSVSGSSKRYTIDAKNVKEIDIIHQYNEHIIPVIKISANVEKAIYKLLTSSVSTSAIYMQVILQKYISNSDVRAKELVFNKKFTVLNENDLQPNEMKMFDSDLTDVATQTTTSVHTDQLVEANFYLVDSERLTNYRKIKSYFLQSASLADVIALMFNDRGFTSLLMNTIPNDTISGKSIPAYNLLASIDYINNRYGIFNSSFIFYMDIIETYLLDKINVGKAIRKNKPGIASLYLETYGTIESASVGSIIYNNTFVINMTGQPSVNKLENYVQYIDGTNMLVIDTDDNISGISGTNDKAIQVFNQKVAKQLQHTTNELKYGLTVGFVNIDIAAIAPNLLYTVVANQKFNSINPISGKYRLNNANIKLIQSDNNNFGLAGTMELIKLVQ